MVKITALRCHVAMLCAMVFCSSAWGANLDLSNTLTVLTYHNIAADPGSDSFAQSRSMFVAQMDYLQTHGYQPISLAQLEEFRQHPERMPAKPVMLTFDDGLKSYYEFVVPVLKTYQYPSVASIVTAWMDGKDVPPEYFGKLMSWDQLREVSRSPLVEIASHTHDLHHGVQSNPQGSQEAASITREYFPAKQRYESEQTFEQRVRIDLQNSIDRLKTELGKKPQAVTWPYGLYDNIVANIATDLGLRYQFSLDDGPTSLAHLPRINRIILTQSGNIEDFIAELSYRALATQKRRFTVIDLDPLLQADTLDKQEQMFSELLDRLEPLRLNMAVMSPFSTDFKKAFYYNGEIPVGADVLRRTIHLLRTKLHIRYVYLHLPAQLPVKNLASVYTKLARLERFDGVVFDADTDKATAELVEKTLSAVLANLKFGYFTSDGKSIDSDEADFVIAKVDINNDIAATQTRTAQLKGIAAPVYLLSKQVYDINDLSLSTVSQRFQSLDIQHFGLQLNTAPIASVLRNNNAPEISNPNSAAGG